MADERERWHFVNLFRSCVVNCISELEGVDPDRDFNFFRLDTLYQTALQFADAFELEESVIQLISQAKDIFSEEDSMEFHNTFECPQVFTGQPGRPKFKVPEEVLRFLLDKRFTAKDMASLLGVSQRTVERRMNTFGLRVGSCYSSIDDVNLETTVRSLVREFPNVGYKRMAGLLLSRGLRIQQNRWRLVIHAGIDGYSRMLVCVQCSGNNRAETVLRMFQAGISSYGLPSRVRTDKGENVGIGQDMLNHPL